FNLFFSVAHPCRNRILFRIVPCWYQRWSESRCSKTAFVQRQNWDWQINRRGRSPFEFQRWVVARLALTAETGGDASPIAPWKHVSGSWRAAIGWSRKQSRVPEFASPSPSASASRQLHLKSEMMYWTSPSQWRRKWESSR